MIGPSACGAGHDHHVSGAQEDGHGLDVARVPAYQEDRSAAEPAKRVREIKERRDFQTHEMETRGEVAQTSERSTWAISVSCVRREPRSTPATCSRPDLGLVEVDDPSIRL